MLGSHMEDAAGWDWLSDLPEGVLHRIMSFLNARQAVQTCVLSRRWRNLWHTVPCINADVDEFDFFYGDAGDSDEEFRWFVNRLLELRDPTVMMDTFWLKCSMMSGFYDRSTPASVDANRWISHALLKQARVIEVVVKSFPLQLNHTVFTSRYLRRIGFSRVSLDQGFFKQLDVSCPVLEDLFLHWCTIADDEISSQTLKILTIDGTKFSMENKTTISTPSVTCLTLSCLEGWTPILNNMPLLVTASVSITRCVYVVEFKVDFGFDANDLRHNLRSLSAAKNLEFIYQGREPIIENNLQWCPAFINVVNMTLGQWCLDTNFYPLIVFLQNSPRLEKLTLKLARYWEKSPRIIGELTERSFTCEYLKIVEVICLEDDPQVITVEDFFVNSGMPSVQFHIKHWSQLNKDQLPAFIRSEDR